MPVSNSLPLNFIGPRQIQHTDQAVRFELQFACAAEVVRNDVLDQVRAEVATDGRSDVDF